MATYFDNNIYTDEKMICLPMVALRGTVPYPAIQMNIEIIRPVSLKAFTAAATVHDAKVILVTQKDIALDEPTEDDFYDFGVVAEIKHVVKNPQGYLSVVFEGISRIKIIDIRQNSGFFLASAEIIDEPSTAVTEEIESLMRNVKARLPELDSLQNALSNEVMLACEAITSPGYLADFVASSALLNYKNRQIILQTLDCKERLENLLLFIEEEIMMLKCEFEINSKVKEKIDRNQRDYFLREQIRVIQSELGEDDDEIAQYDESIYNANIPDEIKEKLYKELSKLSKTPFGAAEGTVLRTYLDTCLEFPFGIKSQESVTVDEAKKILDEDHDGLVKVKERILEFVAIKQFTPDVKSQILCLVGPPGVGKTSVAYSIARALGRKCVRVSLGGMHDEAEIRGHRKTYVGAMPGRIVSALITAGVENPVIILDEIDKIGRDFRGDPTSALLEVLDPEQNKTFRDNFMEINIDLSDTMFIATANGYDGIPTPLLDRMEIIELSTYTDSEKLAIAKNHLIPKQMKINGIKKKMFRITDEGIIALIKGYTREAGVRTLERKLASLMRKAAKKVAEGRAKSVTVTPKNLSEFLGKIKFLPENLENTDSIGIVNGLAYTQTGGDMLKVEVAVMDGSGKIECTGSLGDVMKESAKIAHSYVRTIATRYGIDSDFYKTKDLHIHFPEGAVPKDGPSAGVTMVTAIVSALSGRAVRRDVAMTGEITLRGKVIAIGGLKEKTLAAYRSGVSTVLIPEENLRDLDEIDDEAKANLTFIPCKNATDVLDFALV